MRRRALALTLTAGLAALAGCAPSPRVEPETPPVATPAPAPSPPPPQAAETPTPTADTCGADAHRHLIGHPRSEIPVPLRPERQRVACTTCPVTQDYDPERLTFRFDAATGLIRDVVCG